MIAVTVIIESIRLMPKGGFRPGSGRKQLSGFYKEHTKPVRLPLSVIPVVKEFLKVSLAVSSSRFSVTGHDSTIHNLWSSLTEESNNWALPLYASTVSAGFPSPADDYIETALDLNEHLIKHPAATFFVRVSGDSMINAGIYDQDVLIVDRSLAPKQGDIVIAVLDGELTVKRLHLEKESIILMPENPDYLPIHVTKSMSFSIWGVVTTVIHSVR